MALAEIIARNNARKGGPQPLTEVDENGLWSHTAHYYKMAGGSARKSAVAAEPEHLETAMKALSRVSPEERAALLEQLST